MSAATPVWLINNVVTEVNVILPADGKDF